jgi:hypothetical protein
MSMVFYVDIDKPIVYYVEMSETYSSLHLEATIELIETNF